MCDEIIDAETKSVTKNFNEKKAICKTKNFFILLAFLLIMIALLIAISIYCYLINYKKTKTYIAILHYKLQIKKVLYWWNIIKMESKDVSKETDIKNRSCYYFDDMMRVGGISFTDIFWIKNHMKIF